MKRLGRASSQRELRSEGVPSPRSLTPLGTVAVSSVWALRWLFHPRCVPVASLHGGQVGRATDKRIWTAMLASGGALPPAARTRKRSRSRPALNSTNVSRFRVHDRSVSRQKTTQVRCGRAGGSPLPQRGTPRRRRVVELSRPPREPAGSHAPARPQDAILAYMGVLTRACQPTEALLLDLRMHGRGKRFPGAGRTGLADRHMGKGGEAGLGVGGGGRLVVVGGERGRGVGPPARRAHPPPPEMQHLFSLYPKTLC